MQKMGNSVKFAIFTQIGRLQWQKRKTHLSKNKRLNQLDYYANNHIICNNLCKIINIELLPFSSEYFTYFKIQMFSRASRNNICIKKLDIYVNTHLICIRYANIYNIKKYVLFTH